MTRTHVILDGLCDPQHAQELSARWSRAGFDNAVDASAQCAWLRRDTRHSTPDTQHPTPDTLTDADIARAAAIARAFGLELRDRVGAAFRADNSLEALRQRTVYEYKNRLATALVFGLPALGLHYFGRHLAGGAGDARSMFYPWLFEALLVGWACIAAGWPIIWQAGLAMVHLRLTADVITCLVVAGAFVPSMYGTINPLWSDAPWLKPQSGDNPAFYAANLTVMLAVAQRWLAHRAAPRRAGHAHLMIRGFSQWVGIWVFVMIVAMIVADWKAALAIGMTLPPMIGLGAVNRWSPGASMMLPVAAFAFLLLVGPGVLAVDAQGLRIEIAAGFSLMMTVTMWLGWRAFTRVA